MLTKAELCRIATAMSADAHGQTYTSSQTFTSAMAWSINKPRFWYRIQIHDRYMPDEVVLSPRRRDYDIPVEPARVCVAPTVAQCIAAIFFHSTAVDVLRTKRPVVAVPATGVWDQLITHEHWLLEPIEFVRVNRIEQRRMKRMSSRAVRFLDVWGNSTLKMSLTVLFDAITHIRKWHAPVQKKPVVHWYDLRHLDFIQDVENLLHERELLDIKENGWPQRNCGIWA